MFCLSYFHVQLGEVYERFAEAVTAFCIMKREAIGQSCLTRNHKAAANTFLAKMEIHDIGGRSWWKENSVNKTRLNNANGM